MLDLKFKFVIDMGGNDGIFVRIFLDEVFEVLVIDIDSNVVEYNYW